MECLLSHQLGYEVLEDYPLMVALIPVIISQVVAVCATRLKFSNTPITIPPALRICFPLQCRLPLSVLLCAKFGLSGTVLLLEELLW